MQREIIPYKPVLKEIARGFRNNQTKQEKILWKYLKGKQIKGYDFHRQKPLGSYIVDFYCCELYLAIEIDGSVHNTEDNKVKDVFRQDKIENFGITFLRFTNKEIEYNIEVVINSIKEYINWFEKTRGECRKNNKM
ncbi:MAG: endonuclease domain-containing protein [Bacteroidales bacterium]|nr:endonuclease domain-containing protein [Bacteroidales bacterium]